MPATPKFKCRIHNQTGQHVFVVIRGVADGPQGNFLTNVEFTHSFNPDPLDTGSVADHLYAGERVVMAWDDVTHTLVSMYSVNITAKAHIYVVPYIAAYKSGDTIGPDAYKADASI
jgi:hypothetical protein